MSSLRHAARQLSSRLLSATTTTSALRCAGARAPLPALSRAMCTAAPDAAASAVPFSAELEQQKAFMASVVDMLPGVITEARVQCANAPSSPAEMVLQVRPEDTIPTLRFLKLHSSAQFKCFIHATAVDYPERRARFRVIYNLLSTRFNARIRVQTFVDEVTPLESATSVFKGADWFEREVWDMFGVFFHSHPDMRRILSDYGFQGSPLRKDFPLSGYVEVRYDDTEKRVVQEPVEIAQEYRSFDYSTPWEVFPEGGRPKDALQIDHPAPKDK